MDASTVTTKGTVTIPAHLREVLGIKAGDSVQFVLDETGQRVVMKKRLSLEQLRKRNQTYMKRKKLPILDRDGWLAERNG